MQEFNGSLAGLPWRGFVVERPADLPAFMAWVRSAAQRGEAVAVDTETKGLLILSGDPGYVRLVQFGTATEAWTVPIELGQQFKTAAREALETIPVLVGHNFHGYDALALSASLGMDYDDLCLKATDTMLLAKLVDPRQQSEGGTGAALKPLSARYVDSSAPDTQKGLTAVFRSLKLTKDTGWAGIDLFQPTYQEYALLDVILTARLLPALREQLRRLGVPQRLADYEHRIARICGNMQRTGLVLDIDYTTALSDRLQREAEQNERIARRYGVEKIGSTTQLAEAFKLLGETLTERTASGKVKVDKGVLHQLADIDPFTGERLGLRDPNPLATAVIRAKRAAKWKSAYADNFLSTVDREGRIHPNIQTLAARTGRMSVTNPAVQTLPSGDWMIRRAFLADPGHVMVSTDFDGIELRVLAALADVKGMKRELLYGDGDLHSATARAVYGPNFEKHHRKIAKMINFATVYGGGAATVARQAGLTLEEAKDAVARYHRAYPEVRRFGDRHQREAFDNRMSTVTITGRRIPLDRDRTYAVTNYQVQSAARDCFGQALIHMEDAGLLPYLRLPIHDEVIASVPRAEAAEIGREIAKCMTFDLFGVPITASPEVGGRSWGSLYGANE